MGGPMILKAVLIGIVLGLMELGIIFSARQKLDFWIYVQSALFWFTCGFMIGIVDSPLPAYVLGAILAVFLNLPWYINISIIPKQYSHLVPLIVSSILLGAVGGGLKTLLSTMF